MKNIMKLSLFLLALALVPSAAFAQGSPLCGDGFCDRLAEDGSTCPSDCGFCGDGECAAADGENSINCWEDCGFCGDHTCDPTQFEDATSCPDDCGSCGDGACNAPQEGCLTCSLDCG